MLIDWFTVGAQALNFVILVWMMKRFLYTPVLSAIDVREKLIASELRDADAKRVEAHNERDEFKRKNEEFEGQRAALLSRANDEVKSESRRLMEEVRKAADALGAKREETLRSDAQTLSGAISRRTQQEVFAIARKVLIDLAATSLEERAVEVFSHRLREMNGRAKQQLAEALRSSSEPAVVRSAFELPEAQRWAIQNALNETFAINVQLRFESAPDLVSGIELKANGQKLEWSIAGYLSALEKSVGELLKDQTKPELLAKRDQTDENKGELNPLAKAS